MNSFLQAHGCRLVALFAFLTAGLSAQVTFTVHTTARYSIYGYTAGQNVTFSFVLSDELPNQAPSSFIAWQNFWAESDAAQNPLWATVSGTGLTGNFLAASASNGSPSSITMIKSESGPDDLHFLATNPDLVGSMGLSLPDGTPLRSITASFENVTDFTYPGVFTNPADYFAAYVGTYTPEAPYSMLVVVPVGTLDGGGTSLFTVDEVVISMGGPSIPEPTTFALLFGCSALLGAVVIRRRRTV